MTMVADRPVARVSSTDFPALAQVRAELKPTSASLPEPAGAWRAWWRAALLLTLVRGV
ncbi:MAG: hypothetical protein WKG07_08330 [Hymenobacter sp.]